MSSIIPIGAGIFSLIWLRAYVPRAMMHLRRLRTQHGQSTDKFDAMLESTRYRIAIAVMTAASIGAIVIGVVAALANG